MAFFRSRTGVSLRAERRSTMSDLSFSLREEPVPPMISLISRLFWERVKRSMGFSARGSKGQTPRSGSLPRLGVAAARAVPLMAATGVGVPLVAAGNVLAEAGAPWAGGAAFAEASVDDA